MGAAPASGDRPGAAPGSERGASGRTDGTAPAPAVVPPGTPLYAVPPGGGGPVPVVLLPDGTLAWGTPAPAGRKDAPAPRTARPRKTRR
jgi:hypothetical protein